MKAEHEPRRIYWVASNTFQQLSCRMEVAKTSMRLSYQVGFTFRPCSCTESS